MIASIKTAPELKTLLRMGLKNPTRDQLIATDRAFVSPFLDSLSARTIAEDSNGAKTLTDIFNHQAQRTGNFISSIFVATSNRHMDKMGFAELKNHLAPELHFIRHSNLLFRLTGNSYSLPVVVFDDSILATVAPYSPEKIIDFLTSLYTYGNHDYLHHMTSEAINQPDVCVNKFFQKDGMLKTIFDATLEKHRGDISVIHGDPILENLSLASHAMSFRAAMSNNDFRNTYLTTIDDAVDELARLNANISFTDVYEKSAKETAITYLARGILLSVARIYRLNDPLVIDKATRIFEFAGRDISTPDKFDRQMADTYRLADHMTKVIWALDNDKLFGQAVRNVENCMVECLIGDMSVFAPANFK